MQATQTQTQDRLFFIRHAQSKFNLAQMVAAGQNTEVRAGAEDLNIKFGYELIDCGISEEGIKQCEGSAANVKDLNVKFVISSPLRRCLETTQETFKNHKNKPKVVVWPIVKEMLLSGCDVSDDLATIKKEFPEADFSLVDALPHPELWLVHMLKNETIVNEIFEDLFAKYPNKEEAYKNAKFFLTDKLKHTYPALVESLMDINQRVLEAKERLKPLVKELKDDEVIVVVSHSRFLEAFCSESFAESGEPVNAKWFANCEVAAWNILDN